MNATINTFMRHHRPIRQITLSLMVFWSSALLQPAFAQQSLTLTDALNTALKNNEGLKSSALEVDYYREVKKSSGDIGKFSAGWMHGQYNSVYQDNNFTLTQTLPFPTAMTSLARLGKEEIRGAEKALASARNDLIYEVSLAYLQLQYLQSVQKLLMMQDSLFEGFNRASAVRYRTGEGNLLEKTTAESQSLDAKNLIRQNEGDIAIQQTRLQALLKNTSPISAADKLSKRAVDSLTLNESANPRLDWLRQQLVIGSQAKRVEQQKLLPDITFGYFNQSLRGVQNVGGTDTYYSSATRFQGFQLGVAFPLWIRPYVSRVRAAAVREEQLKINADYFATTLGSQMAQAREEIRKNQATLKYFETTALKNASLILTQAQQSFSAGEIGYVEYLQSLKTSSGIRAAYLQALLFYNQSILKAEFLTGTY